MTYVRYSAVLLMFMLLAFVSCSSSEQSDSSLEILVGKVQVIGNAPFTRLAIEAEDGVMYVVRCEKEVETTLASNQGRLVKVHFRGMEVVPGGKSINVVRAELVSR